MTVNLGAIPTEALLRELESRLDAVRPGHIIGQALAVAMYYHLQKPRPAMSNAIDTKDLLTVFAPDMIDRPTRLLDGPDKVALDFGQPLPFPLPLERSRLKLA